MPLAKTGSPSRGPGVPILPLRKLPPEISTGFPPSSAKFMIPYFFVGSYVFFQQHGLSIGIWAPGKHLFRRKN
jgi:hypothetical protein